MIVGAGIIGMTIAYELKRRNSKLHIAIIDKENDVAKHASGRNSGVLHAGFYYTFDSLKAKLTVKGNQKMKEFCKNNNIFINDTKKIVVAKNEQEAKGIIELQKRAEKNGVNTRIINEEEVKSIDPNIKTYKRALYSPSTASIDPKEVCKVLKLDLINQGVDFYFNMSFEKSNLKYKYLINAAGAYADKIAKKFNLGKNYTMLPFKGIYLKYEENKNRC